MSNLECILFFLVLRDLFIYYPYYFVRQIWPFNKSYIIFMDSELSVSKSNL